jgi:hypothetical protein
MKWLGPIVWALILAEAAPCAAGFTVVTNRNSFNALTNQRQSILFEGLADPGGQAWYGTSAGLTLDGTNFSGQIPGSNWLLVVDPAATPELYDWGSGATLVGPSSSLGAGSALVVTLPPHTTAFGTDLMSFVPVGHTFAPAQETFTITLSSGDSFSALSGDFPARAFVGVLADAPITSVRLTVGDEAFPLIDNFTVCQTAPVPASLVLWGMSGALFFAYRRPWRLVHPR